MSEPEGKPPQGTSLSAEVEPFIPAQLNSTRAAGGWPQQGNPKPGRTVQSPSTGQAKMATPPSQVGTPNGSGFTLTELPHYLTNCYPFVQDGITGTGPKPDVRWHYTLHPQPPPMNISLSCPPPPTDMYTNQHYPTQSPNYFMQYPQNYYPQPQGPPLHSHGTMQTSVPVQGSYNVPLPYTEYYPSYLQEGNQAQMGSYQSAGYGSCLSREPVPRQSRFSSSRDRQSAASHSVRDRSSSSSSREGRRGLKTLVCIEAACQTDFPDEIANKTLAEKPSMLRRHKTKPRRKSQGNQTGQETSTSTDSEIEAGVVDSDSGYYSPKHGKTSHASVGMATQDAATGPTIKAQGYQQYSGTVVGTVLEHVHQTHQPLGGTPVNVQSGTVHPVTSQMMPPAGNFLPPQSMLHTASPRLLHTRMPLQHQKYMQPPPIAPHLPQAISYARVLSQPSPQRHPALVLNQTAHFRPMGPVHPQAHFNNAVDNAGKVFPVPGGPFSGSQRQTTKYIPMQENTDNIPVANSKRKKKKDRKRGGKNVEDHKEQRSQIPTQPPPPPPALTDMGDFPELPLGSSGVSDGHCAPQVQPHSYSAILQQQRNNTKRQKQSDAEVAEPADSQNATPGDIIKPEDLLNPEAAASGIRDGKNARKRRKKAILAAEAAAKEYSEITEEQRQLQENLKKPSKKTKMPIEYDLGDMLAALEKQQQETKAKTQQQVLAGKNSSVALAMTPNDPQQLTLLSTAKIATARPSKQLAREREVIRGHNPLDSSAPVKRGKEREMPAKKKPSALKRVILKEREEKKRLRTLQETCLSDAEESLTQGDEKTSDAVNGDAGLALSQDTSEKGSNMSPFMTSQSDLSPLSQMSPMSLSPLSPGSPLSSGLSSPATGFKSATPAQISPSIHSRRFREYCNQVLDKDIDACCTTLLQALVRFQDRQYHRDPTKAKAKRRIVMGLREVTKHLKLRKIKCIMVSPNLERIQSKGGLDDALNRIMTLSTEQDVPVVFALGRKALGRAVNKLVPVSVVGIFNYDGAEEFYKNLLDLTKNARESYTAMIRKYQQEVEAAANVVPFPKHRHHLGHYRNLSGCSGISFSSVISEPISEDYPDPEPEVDSRGNEIVREVRFDDTVTTTQYAAAAPVSTLTTPESVDTEDNVGGYESDKGFSQEGAYSEDSGTVEQGTSKTSSETLDAAELDDVDYEDEDAYELGDVDDDDELDVIDNHYHRHDSLGDDDDDDEIDMRPVLNSKTDLPVDKGRIATWVAETQNSIQSLTLQDDDLEKQPAPAGNMLDSHKPSIQTGTSTVTNSDFNSQSSVKTINCNAATSSCEAKPTSESCEAVAEVNSGPSKPSVINGHLIEDSLQQESS